MHKERGRSSRFRKHGDHDECVVAYQKHLILHLIFDWSRRHRSLVEVCCGKGQFLEMFWKAGFDVTGIDASPTKIYSARSRLGNRAELHLGQADHLSFDDRQFDYVAMINTFVSCQQTESAIKEGLRVAKRGLLIGFVNRFSLYSLIAGMSQKMTRASDQNNPEQGRSLATIKDIIGHHVPGSFSLTAGSVIPCPVWTWIPSCLFHKIYGKIYSPHLGMFSAVRVDLLDEKPLTPLMAWKTELKTI